jgi:glycosyltransferase involved in cell wall biosynthesis
MGTNVAAANDTPPSPPLVCILLSLYKAEKYLRVQLESLRNQQGVRVHIRARDDGSPDHSGEAFVNLCTELGLSHEIESGVNLGASESFLELMYGDLEAFDYVALCDQDDWWIEDKLSGAVEMLHAHGDTPAIYCSAHTLADKELNPISDSKPPASTGFGNALIQNVVQGATAVLNRSGVILLQEIGRPRQCGMHDWWCYIVLSALGRVIYDPRPTIRYRQHDANVVGASHSFFAQWRRRIARRLREEPGQIMDQARDLRDLAMDRLGPEEQSILGRLVGSRRSLAARLGLAADRRIWRQDRLSDIVWRALVVSGRY